MFVGMVYPINSVYMMQLVLNVNDYLHKFGKEVHGDRGALVEEHRGAGEKTSKGKKKRNFNTLNVKFRKYESITQFTCDESVELIVQVPHPSE